MSKIKIGLIGGGWRAEFYVRIAHQLSELFEISYVCMRNAEKAAEFTDRFHIPVLTELRDFIDKDFDYVILAVKRNAIPEYLEELFRADVPVLCETPPAETMEGLTQLWELHEKYSPKISVAEQYFLQPYHQSVLKIVENGMLGEISSVNISMMHGYHAANMIRRYLGVNFENCVISGKRYPVPSVRNCGRGGMIETGEVVQSTRDIVTLDFENGKNALYDFNSEQYFSYIRTRHLCVFGVQGEVYDFNVNYLDSEFHPVTDELKRVDLGLNSNLEGYGHRGFLLGGRYVYRNPYESARLSDDEIAVAGCMERMYESLHGKENYYPLEQALQDSYLSILMAQTAETGIPRSTERQPWAK